MRNEKKSITKELVQEAATAPSLSSSSTLSKQTTTTTTAEDVLRAENADVETSTFVASEQDANKLNAKQESINTHEQQLQSKVNDIQERKDNTTSIIDNVYTFSKSVNEFGINELDALSNVITDSHDTFSTEHTVEVMSSLFTLLLRRDCNLLTHYRLHILIEALSSSSDGLLRVARECLSSCFDYPHVYEYIALELAECDVMTVSLILSTISEYLHSD